MSRNRKLLLFVVLFLLYNVVSGGGLVVVHSDSLSTLGSVAKAQLTEEASIYLKQTPTTKQFYAPFVCSYVRHTYPFKLRYYGSTRDGSIRVSEVERDGDATNVVVTGVRWYRRPADGMKPAEVFHGSTWNGILIPGPGEWIIESEGYVVKRQSDEREPLTFPSMTVRPTIEDQVRVTGLIYYFFSQLPV